jgi:hypothetical protein
MKTKNGHQSQFDLSMTPSVDQCPTDINSLIYQSQLNSNNANSSSNNMNSSNVNNTLNGNPLSENLNSINLLQVGGVAGQNAKLCYDFNSNNFNNSSFNAHTNHMNSKKQINDHIMRTCMGYLDFINKKHNRERRLQTIRNKISGFVLLTMVFMMVFGLALIMTFSLTRELTKIINNKTQNSLSVNHQKTNKSVDSTTSINDSNEIKKNRTKVGGPNSKSSENSGLQTFIRFSPAFFKMAQLIKKKNRAGLSNETSVFEDKDLESSVKHEIKVFADRLTPIFSSSKSPRLSEINIKKRMAKLQREIYDLIVGIVDESVEADESEDNIGENEESLLHYYKFIDELNY